MLLDVSDGVWESISLLLLSVEVFIGVDMVVVSRSWSNMFLLSFVLRPIWVATSAPSAILEGLYTPIVLLDGAGKLIVARSWSINLLWSQMRLLSERRVKSASISLDTGCWLSSIIKARSKLELRTTWLEISVVDIGSRSLLMHLWLSGNSSWLLIGIRLEGRLNRGKIRSIIIVFSNSSLDFSFLSSIHAVESEVIVSSQTIIGTTSTSSIASKTTFTEKLKRFVK